jgi:Tol biopolymer transport system component
VSAVGSVAYRSGSAGSAELGWFNASGASIATIGEPDPNALQYPELSRDGRRLAVTRTVQVNQDIWLTDSKRSGWARFTFDAANDTCPLWSPDGTRIIFSSNRKGAFNLYLAPVDAPGGEAELLESSNAKVAQDWSSDGRFLLFYESNPRSGRDLWSLDLSDTHATPQAVANTVFDETLAQFSPDGHWVAYQTNESSRFEIVVQPFPNPRGVKWQVSSGGGVAPRWRPDGKELYFIAPDAKLMAAAIVKASSAEFGAGTPMTRFQTRISGGGAVANNRPNYAVAADGRFLMVQPLEEALPITLILNPNLTGAK